MSPDRIMNHTAYIGIGSNLGDRLQNCTDALQILHEHEDIEVMKVSGWYETRAEDQDGQVLQDHLPYVNGAAQIETDLSPEKLMKVLLDAECALGRPMKRKKGSPRIVDLDLLLYEGKIKNTEKLVLPHPSLGKRMFVLKPLYDIAPEAIEPVSGKKVADLMNSCLAEGTANHATRLDELTEDVDWE